MFIKVSRGSQKWTNAHKTFIQDTRELLDVANSDEANKNILEKYNIATNGIMNIIGEYKKLNQSLRMYGGGWSWTKVAATNGIMVNSKLLNLTFQVSENVSSRYAKTWEDLYFVQGGITINDLNRKLATKNRSLPTSGASNGQTIAGAISTGVHGSAIDFGSMTEFVVGLHIIVDEDRHYYIERASYPVVTDGFGNKLNTEIIRNDTIFNAALVSFGSFGIIAGVMIETVPLFLYESSRKTFTFDQNVKDLVSTLDFTSPTSPLGNNRPYHFQVLLNPYSNPLESYITANSKIPYRTDYTKPASTSSLNLGDDGPAFLGRVFELFPGLISGSVGPILKTNYKEYNKQYGTHGEIFSNSGLRGKVYSYAIGVPMHEVLRTIDLIINLNKTDGPITGIISLRYVARSSALLGFTKYDPTCIIEVDGFANGTMSNFYNKLSDVLLLNNITHTFHWGKILKLNKTRIKEAYGADIVHQWLAARKYLLENDQVMQLFSNPLLREWGLDEIVDDNTILYVNA